jgi:hypothetical protein
MKAARDDQILDFIGFDVRAEWELTGEQPGNLVLPAPGAPGMRKTPSIEQSLSPEPARPRNAHQVGRQHSSGAF